MSVKGLAPRVSVKGLAPRVSVKGLAPRVSVKGLAPRVSVKGLAPRVSVKGLIWGAFSIGIALWHLLERFSGQTLHENIVHNTDRPFQLPSMQSTQSRSKIIMWSKRPHQKAKRRRNSGANVERSNDTVCSTSFEI